MDASVVCAQLQFSAYGTYYNIVFEGACDYCSPTGAIAVDGSEFTSTSNPVLIGAVNCTGMEVSLSDCSIETFQGTCIGEVAGIVCQGEQIKIIH